PAQGEVFPPCGPCPNYAERPLSPQTGNRGATCPKRIAREGGDEAYVGLQGAAPQDVGLSGTESFLIPTRPASAPLRLPPKCGGEVQSQHRVIHPTHHRPRLVTAVSVRELVLRLVRKPDAAKLEVVALNDRWLSHDQTFVVQTSDPVSSCSSTCAVDSLYPGIARKNAATP